jgi:hypothetical protein
MEYTKCVGRYQQRFFLCNLTLVIYSQISCRCCLLPEDSQLGRNMLSRILLRARSRVSKRGRSHGGWTRSARCTPRTASRDTGTGRGQHSIVLSVQPENTYVLPMKGWLVLCVRTDKGPTFFSNMDPGSGKAFSSAPSWSREGLSNPELRHVGTEAKARRKRPTPIFNTYRFFGLCGEGLKLTRPNSYISLSVSVFLVLYTHTALVFIPICFTPFSFNAPYKFIPLFNLRPLFSVFTPYGWLCSMTLTPCF